MRNRYELDLKDAELMLEAAKQHALANHWAVSIAVVDQDGRLITFARLDGASPLSVDLAQGKARTAALGRKASKAYEDMVKEGRVSLLSADKLTCLEGGHPVQYEGQYIGAVGVSGVASSDDALIALAGIAALS